MASLDTRPREQKLDLLEQMVLIREFEDQAAEAFLDAEFPGTLHLCIGQEASAVGAVGALEPEDPVVSTHRGHGHELAKGIDPDRMMAELYGKVQGYNRGKGGSMHVAHEPAGLMGGNGIVAASFPLATGAGLAAKYRGLDRVGVGFTGDGGIAQGQAHEAMNLAATWDLPVLFVVENNQYGETTPVDRQHNVDDLSETAAAYDIPGRTVDGTDVEAVHDTVSRARERAVAGDGPTLIETEVCRYRSHSEGHPTPYRDDGEVEAWREHHDPIETYSDQLIDEGLLTDEAFEAMVSDVQERIEATVSYARSAEDPPTEEAYADMFAEPAPEIDHFRDRMASTEPLGFGDGSYDSDVLAPVDHSGVPTETLSIREAVNEALREEMQRDDDVMLYGEDVADYEGIFKTTRGLLDQFGWDRVRDTPISEAGFVGAGIGAALNGIRPVVEVMYVDFFGVACEQMLNQAAKLRYAHGDAVPMPVTFRTTEGAAGGQAPQHSSTMHTWFAHLPGVKAVAPGTPHATKGALKAAIRSDDPVVFFENKSTYGYDGEVPAAGDHVHPLGEASVERPGDDVTVVATQRLLHEALDLAEGHEQDLEVIDPVSLYPLDVETIAHSLRKTGRLVIADESTLSYGLHGEVVSRLVEDEFYNLDAPPQRVGVPDVHVPFSPPLEEEVTPTSEDIANAIDRLG